MLIMTLVGTFNDFIFRTQSLFETNIYEEVFFTQLQSLSDLDLSRHTHIYIVSVTICSHVILIIYRNKIKLFYSCKHYCAYMIVTSISRG